MNFHVMTLFPEMVENCLKESITGRAIAKGIIQLEAVNIRDYAQNRYKHVDDYIYGGGSGMLMQPEPVWLCYQDLVSRLPQDKKVKTLYMSPQGRTFDQKFAEELAEEEDLIFLCGHYEGIDERVIEMIEPIEVSLGDFVLTGGELPAITMIDCISRLVPGVLGKDDSAVYESFYEGLLEYPQYTRPEVYMGRAVPKVLLSGDHKKVDEWRKEQAIERTKKKRPDLYAAYQELHKDDPVPKKKRKKKKNASEAISESGEIKMKEDEAIE